MTEIVQVQPRPFKFSLIHAVLIGACFAGPGLVWAHNAHQAETTPAEIIYPAAETARQVVLVGVGCGPDKITVTLTGAEEDGFIWECEDIQAHSTEAGA